MSLYGDTKGKEVFRKPEILDDSISVFFVTKDYDDDERVEDFDFNSAYQLEVIK